MKQSVLTKWKRNVKVPLPHTIVNSHNVVIIC